MKKLYKSTADKKLCGVCGGVAEYLGVDPTAVRFVWTTLAVCGGLGLIAYVVGLILIPDNKG